MSWVAVVVSWVELVELWLSWVVVELGLGDSF